MAFFFQDIFCRQQLFTLIALVPPVVIAIFIHDVGQLVALTVSGLKNHLLFLIL